MHRYPKLGIDRVLAMDGAERVNRSLDDYDERSKLTTTAQNHQVYKVSDRVHLH